MRRGGGLFWFLKLEMVDCAVDEFPRSIHNGRMRRRRLEAPAVLFGRLAKFNPLTSLAVHRRDNGDRG